jgi:hypothetical protein
VTEGAVDIDGSRDGGVALAAVLGALAGAMRRQVALTSLYCSSPIFASFANVCQLLGYRGSWSPYPIGSGQLPSHGGGPTARLPRRSQACSGGAGASTDGLQLYLERCALAPGAASSREGITRARVH